MKPDFESLLSLSDKISLHIQRFLGWILFPPLGLLTDILIRYKFKLKIKDLEKIRAEFKQIVSDRKPLLICANHLTYVDSIMIIWALSSLRTLFLNYRLFAWNIPAIENYASKPHWRIFTFLGKCIPMDRFGDKAHQDLVFNKLCYLMQIGDLCMVFPEGTRSRSGMVNTESISYGPGRLVNSIPDCRVLCIYFRGENQEKYSDFPKSGDIYSLNMQIIAPKSDSKGLRAVRDISQQIIRKIKEMEDLYFGTENKSSKTI